MGILLGVTLQCGGWGKFTVLLYRRGILREVLTKHFEEDVLRRRRTFLGLAGGVRDREVDGVLLPCLKKGFSIPPVVLRYSKRGRGITRGATGASVYCIIASFF